MTGFFFYQIPNLLGFVFVTFIMTDSEGYAVS
jgi:hypothetical protein